IMINADLACEQGTASVDARRGGLRGAQRRDTPTPRGADRDGQPFTLISRRDRSHWPVETTAGIEESQVQQIALRVAATDAPRERGDGAEKLGGTRVIAAAKCEDSATRR